MGGGEAQHKVQCCWSESVAQSSAEQSRRGVMQQEGSKTNTSRFTVLTQ